MSNRWYSEHRSDPWRRKARQEGYRARSAFKLKEIQEKFTPIRNGDAVLDVGCAPGGWSQVACELVGNEGIVVGVDLQTTSPIEGAHFIVGDIQDDLIQNSTREAFEGRVINTVISDISPEISGRYDIDQAISIDLVTMVCDFSLPLLNPGGAFITKIFQGPGLDALVKALKRRFSKVHRFSPISSRNASSEIYLVCKNLKPHHGGLIQTVGDEIEDSLARDGIVDLSNDEDDIVAKTGFSVHRRD
ncbi:MAG TPA: RlmE family RNA methyltransferase [Candidatus Thalassarchaeaceae archaeon]|jgi:23S rRNA (uridine2552-2'-O)-methyltransferase|nr:RlmE family RNA methyltransferase [Candidatus Thalassarchaeaceae archaeon]